MAGWGDDLWGSMPYGSGEDDDTQTVTLPLISQPAATMALGVTIGTTVALGLINQQASTIAPIIIIPNTPTTGPLTVGVGDPTARPGLITTRMGNIVLGEPGLGVSGPVEPPPTIDDEDCWDPDTDATTLWYDPIELGTTWDPDSDAVSVWVRTPPVVCD